MRGCSPKRLGAAKEPGVVVSSDSKAHQRSSKLSQDALVEAHGQQRVAYDLGLGFVRSHPHTVRGPGPVDSGRVLHCPLLDEEWVLGTRNGLGPTLSAMIPLSSELPLGESALRQGEDPAPTPITGAPGGSTGTTQRRCHHLIPIPEDDTFLPAVSDAGL